MTDSTPRIPLDGAPVSSTPEPRPAPSVPRAPPTSRSRRTWNILGILAVAAIVAISSLYLLGLPPFHAAAGNRPHGPVTFSQARVAADTYMQGYPSGPWRLIAAEAILLRANLPYSVASAHGTFLNCSVQSLLPGPAGSVPAFQGDVRAGVSPIWGLIYWGNGSGRIVSVVNGSASVSSSISGGASCQTLVGAAQTVPATIADSAAVSQAVSEAGGAAFWSGHSSANVTMALQPGFSYLGFNFPPQWLVTYSLCSLESPHPSPAPEFRANVTASGVITMTHQGTAGCTAGAGALGVTLVHRLAFTGISSVPLGGALWSAQRDPG